jgi:molybdenum cofactor synthesis domain-containing protein
MTRETLSKNSIALLATGDEIINGDILNTNAQEIAQTLFAHDMQIGMHMTVGDNTAEIKLAIRFLLQHHRALIITGGLGPTTDDLTRYALADALNRELIFDESIWKWIGDRFAKLGLTTPPENNRQQALFPEEAVIIPNSNGTAAGCILKEDEHLIFMLPGPPLECLPMIDKIIVPALKIAGFQQVIYHANWLLFGVSEGHIAEQLEEITQHFECTTGYRVCYPYVEIKLHSTNKKEFDACVPFVEKELSPYMIEEGKQTASDLLKKKLLTLDQPLTIIDSATGGSLEATIKTPDTHTKLNFISENTHSTTSDSVIQISGLDDFWQHKQETHTLLEITFTNQQGIKPGKFKVPYRGSRVKLYAVEFICQKIYQYLSSSERLL